MVTDAFTVWFACLQKWAEPKLHRWPCLTFHDVQGSECHCGPWHTGHILRRVWKKSFTQGVGRSYRGDQWWRHSKKDSVEVRIFSRVGKIHLSKLKSEIHWYWIVLFLDSPDLRDHPLSTYGSMGGGGSAKSVLIWTRGEKGSSWTVHTF